MTLALRHAIYSTILNTEAMATFMFLPASTGSKLMTMNPYSKLFTAYLLLCYKLGTIPETEVTYDSLRFWPSQEIALLRCT
eukprot:1149361-Pelagomonas_calceolata.AAC.3